MSKTPPTARKGLALAALGIVFGDIGTSPLYAVRECFRGEFGIPASSSNVLGVISLIIWALILIISVKYLTFILRADNDGEGGVLVLSSLACPSAVRAGAGRGWPLAALGIFAACLLYGDGMITPAISVLSAIEGLDRVTPAFSPYVDAITIAILAGLFAFQRRGTGGLGKLFGPVILLWFAVIGTLGAIAILEAPAILAAFNPAHAFTFLFANSSHGFVVLGAVFLVATGGEAIYSDLGHFDRRSIRLGWYTVVLPGLLLSYLGQGAHVLTNPADVAHPFYSIVPSWAVLPVVALATAATIIASQAVITGAFSLTRQAIQFGFLPRLKILHTSAKHEGQIYIPSVNWVLAIACIGLVIGFRTSSQLAAAYGIAVSLTMAISTIIFFAYLRNHPKFPTPLAALLCGGFLLIDLGFFASNATKITHGGWFPLVVAGIAFTLMTTWKKGRRLVRKHSEHYAIPLSETLRSLSDDSTETNTRVPGTAIFLYGSNTGLTPQAFAQNLKHNHVIHRRTIFLSIINDDIPRVPNLEKISIEDIGQGFTKIHARFGYMETPSISTIIALASAAATDRPLDPEEISYFVSRERIFYQKDIGLSRWREGIFALMTRNAQGSTDYYQIPPSQVVEVGARVYV